MAAATIAISESNTSSETVTDDVSSLNFGTVDSPNLSAGSNAITPGNNSYEKYVRFQVSAMGDATAISNLRIFASGVTFPIDSGTYVKTSATTSGYSAPSYATPVTTTSTVATATIATSDPAAANIGIASSLTGTLTSAGYSDYCVLQIQTNASDTSGDTIVLRFQWDEVA